MSTLVPEAMESMQNEVGEKGKKGQVRVVLWDDTKKALPKNMKVSRILMVPHKS